MRLNARLKRIERTADELRDMRVRMASRSGERTVFTLAQMQSAYERYVPELLARERVTPSTEPASPTAIQL